MRSQIVDQCLFSICVSLRIIPKVIPGIVECAVHNVLGFG